MLYQKYNRIRQIKFTPIGFIFPALFFFILITEPNLMAQTGQAANDSQLNYEQALNNTPEGLSFTIRFREGKAQFRRGETISIELVFSSRVPKTYNVNNRGYDRSGRLGIDTYNLSSDEGITDPLYDYFHAPFMGFIGGGLSSPRFLEEKPFVITQELNEWHRFDRLGKYQLYVSTNRISKKDGPDSMRSGETEVPLVSNVLEFEIVADDQNWSEQKLREAIAILDRRNEKDKPTACRTLRFMVSAGAAREMVKRLRGEEGSCDGEFYFGLIGSPHRRIVIDEMERQFAAPEHPVSGSFLSLLSLLSFVQENQMPLSPPADASEEELERYQQSLKKHQIAYQDFQIEYVKKLISIIPGKKGKARAMTANTMFANLAIFPSIKFRDIAEPIKSISEEFVTKFSELPADHQYNWLEYGWKSISTPALLPALRSIYKNPPKSIHPMRDATLKRIYEISPLEGRRLILDEVRSPNPQVGIKTLGTLPDVSLPELDDVLTENFEKGEYRETISFLIERYASSAAMPRILAASEKNIGRMACAPQSALLAYFLRIDPQQGAEIIKQALAARENTACYRSLLNAVAQLHMSSELEQIAISTLSDTDAETVANAAFILQQHGSGAAEGHLWQRLEQWNEQWLSKKVSVETPSHDESANWIEMGLIRALSLSVSWITGKDKLQKIYNLCHTRNGREEIKRLIDQWDNGIDVNFNQSDDSIMSIILAHYDMNSLDELKKKLAQFPRGSSFFFASSNSGSEKELEIFDDLKNYLSTIGMKIERKK